MVWRENFERDEVGNCVVDGGDGVGGGDGGCGKRSGGGVVLFFMMARILSRVFILRSCLVWALASQARAVAV